VRVRRAVTPAVHRRGVTPPARTSPATAGARGTA
jgi:hypothetical protein